jgi:type I restriction enzyme R subunit
MFSERRNLVLIADKVHCSQHDLIDGFARHLRDALPTASFIGFTSAPIELTDKNTELYSATMSASTTSRRVDSAHLLRKSRRRAVLVVFPAEL